MKTIKLNRSIHVRTDKLIRYLREERDYLASWDTYECEPVEDGAIEHMEGYTLVHPNYLIEMKAPDMEQTVKGALEDLDKAEAKLRSDMETKLKEIEDARSDLRALPAPK